MHPYGNRSRHRGRGVVAGYQKGTRKNEENERSLRRTHGYISVHIFNLESTGLGHTLVLVGLMRQPKGSANSCERVDPFYNVELHHLFHGTVLGIRDEHVFASISSPCCHDAGSSRCF